MSNIAVISGTTHGIGRVTCRELARAGRQIVMLCRNVPVAEEVKADLLRQFPGTSLDIVHCDLASLASVRRCAATVVQSFGRIDLLINNAGMTTTTRKTSPDGFELQFATNHLGPFLLTSLLQERLTENARVVTVASRAHFRVKDRMNLAMVTDANSPYSAVQAYAQSKLANVLHTFALARRLQGSGITVNCLHPGVVATNLLPWWLRLVKPLISRVIDVERGSRTSIYLALSPAVAGQSGRYYDENSVPVPASALANEVSLQESLWTQSARWVAQH